VGYNLKATKKAFDPIPDDRYTLKVETTKVEPHEKNGVTGEKIEITYRICGGEFENRKVWDYVYLPGALWKARAILEAGENLLAESEDVTADVIASALMGLQVSAFLETTLGENGNLRTNVKEYKPIKGDLPGILD
jgi:hypothetical protein